ncbi:MAG TPA: hypothetical protein VFM17_06205, partial [Candidatus Eisenbacteria bacterium]|nr:hypothetical protein [Candidatus Eisenbacteria bacterium]
MRRVATLACIALLVSLPPAARHAEAQWRLLGLSAHRVNRLAVHEGYLYACTNQGLYRRLPGTPGTQWGLPTLGQRNVLDVTGLGPGVLLAAVQLTSDPADSVSLFRGSGLDPFFDTAVWEPFQNGFGAGGGASERQARRILPLSGFPATLLATSSRIEKSTDNGATWRVVTPSYGVINAIEQSLADPQLVWAGGETNIFSPYASQSSDAGESWTQFHLFAGGDNAVDGIAPHPANAYEVYLGMEGRVMKSQDGGATWANLTAPDTTIYTFGMAARPFPPLKLYAAGATAGLDYPVRLHKSWSDSIYWETTSFPHPAPGDDGVYHLLVLGGSGSVTVYLATSNGVFSHSEIPTGAPVSDSGWDATLRSRPNPFRGRTEIEFALGSSEAVSLRVVDVRGRVVASLIRSTLGPGPHRAAWSADHLPAGIYFARL